MKICILDYGSGNVTSVFNMLKFIEFEPEISNEKKKIKDASHIILPGVGSYKSGMEKIKKTLPIDFLENEILKKGKPFLGICLGMQVLSTIGYEFGEYDGLNWIEGEVKKLDVKKSVLPHVGWNEVTAKSNNNILFKNIKIDENFYFVHSYYFNIFKKKMFWRPPLMKLNSLQLSEEITYLVFNFILKKSKIWDETFKNFKN